MNSAMQFSPFLQHPSNYLVYEEISNKLEKIEHKHIEVSENTQLKSKLSSNERLYKSLKMLANKSFNISEIAYSLGFNDPKYFSRCFKNAFGQTPKEFRELKLRSLRLTNDLNFDENFVAKANSIVQEKFSQQDFGVDELASDLNVSYSTLYRKIKTTSGISPCDFIRKARIKNAMNMMAQTTLSFSDIAFATGFCNYSYFSRCFKSENGFFPSEYAQNL